MDSHNAQNLKPLPAWLSRLRRRLSPNGQWTIPLRDLEPADLGEVGAKALALGRMLRAGLPVPPGFVLTVAAFRAAVQSAPHTRSLGLDLAQLDPAASPALEALSWQLREALAHAEMPAGVEQAVAQALNAQPGVRLWAVRSSATAEDLPHASFAGQHESFLNVPREEVLDRVRGCWASLFGPRALAYRRRNGLAFNSTGMAVIVQQMVPADAAGVLFTADPASGAPNRIVLEGAAGLGDRVVSGRVAPDRLVMSRPTLEVLENRAGQPPAETTGDDARSSPARLDAATARRLARLSLRVERVLRGPLDIEWAVCGNEVHLLQARPITSRPAGKSWEERQVWTNLNTGEVAPDVASPATWSIIQEFFYPLFGSFFCMLGADIRRSPIAGLVAGRIYFNANTALASFKPFFFLFERIPNLAEALGGGQREDYRSLYIPPEDLPDLGFRWPKFILSWPRSLYTLARHSPRRGDAWTARLKHRVIGPAPGDLEAMSTEQLTRAFSYMLRHGFEGWDLLYLLTQGFALPLFQKACRDWLDDPHLTLGYRLFAGLGGMPEVEAGLALWRLATLAQADPETAATVRSAAGWPQARDALSRTAHGKRFLEAWTQFMEEHGHHCRGELELFNARWSETPDYILGLVRGYLGSLGQIDPLEQQRRLAREREALAAQCRARLKNPVKRWLFWRALGRAQRLAVNREEWKNQAVRQLVAWRRLLLALGRRLHEQGTLASPDDIFFLELPEVESAAIGRPAFNVRERIRRRRREYEANLAVSPPQVVVGRFNPATAAIASPAGNSDLLTGIPVSPGVVTGRAKIILRTDDHLQVLPGEILVAPFTDPAWTPYFLTAAGVVTDQGGILSHGSIVAREYGLPAVTNVGSATRLLRTGDLLQVDGNRGRVTVLERQR